MHSQGVVHRDLKAENLFFGKEFKLKIGDFGSADVAIKSDGSTLLTEYSVGTEIYNAPEINARIPYSGIFSDIF